MMVRCSSCPEDTLTVYPSGNKIVVDAVSDLGWGETYLLTLEDSKRLRKALKRAEKRAKENER